MIYTALADAIKKELAFEPTRQQGELIDLLAQFCCMPTETKSFILKGFDLKMENIFLAALKNDTLTLKEYLKFGDVNITDDNSNADMLKISDADNPIIDNMGSVSHTVNQNNYGNY